MLIWKGVKNITRSETDDEKEITDESHCMADGYGTVYRFFSVGGMAKEAEAQSIQLLNPSQNSRGNVTWDCVWFGSYPQTEVIRATDTTLIAVMKEKNKYYEMKYQTVSEASWKAITGAKYNQNGDATVNGVKYRRIRWGDTTLAKYYDSFSMGSNKMEYGISLCI